MTVDEKLDALTFIQLRDENQSLLSLLREAREMLADEFGEPCKVLNGGSGCNHENCVLLIRIDAKLKEAGE